MATVDFGCQSLFLPGTDFASQMQKRAHAPALVTAPSSPGHRDRPRHGRATYTELVRVTPQMDLGSRVLRHVDEE